MSTAASPAASATAQRPRSRPLMPPAFTAASAGESEAARSAPLKLRCVYVTHGRKNAASATIAPTSATARAGDSVFLISGSPARAVRGERGVSDDVSRVGARRVERRADRAEHVGEVSTKGGDEVSAALESPRLLGAVDLA